MRAHGRNAVSSLMVSAYSRPIVVALGVPRKWNAIKRHSFSDVFDGFAVLPNSLCALQTHVNNDAKIMDGHVYGIRDGTPYAKLLFRRQSRFNQGFRVLHPVRTAKRFKSGWARKIRPAASSPSEPKSKTEFGSSCRWQNTPSHCDPCVVCM